MKGILGRKIGMTQVFTTDGRLIPVTVVEAAPNVVLQKKTVATDGYDAKMCIRDSLPGTSGISGDVRYRA